MLVKFPILKMLVYQSPISLQRDHSFHIRQNISSTGKNRGAKFDPETKNFYIQDKIVLEANNQLYDMVEYHFHVPGEHKIDGTIYSGELHFVFRPQGPIPAGLIDFCGGKCPKGIDHIFVIGFGLTNDHCPQDLARLQVALPTHYYEYDGSNTTPDFTPARWIINREPMPFDLEQLIGISKSARPLRLLHGRIILHGKRDDC